MTVACKECGHVHKNYTSIRRDNCVNCGASKSLRYRKYGECAGCKKRFMYYTSCSSNTRRYCSDRCYENYGRRRKNTLAASDDGGEFLTPRIRRVVIEEIMVNGENGFLDIIKAGRMALFGGQSEFKEDPFESWGY